MIAKNVLWVSQAIMKLLQKVYVWPILEFCEAQWYHRKLFWMATRWKQWYISPSALLLSETIAVQADVVSQKKVAYYFRPQNFH